MTSPEVKPKTGIFAPVLHSAGRAIALSRLVLASVFLLAIYIDPTQPATAPAQIYLLLGVYVAVAAGLSAVAWRSWWWDHKLARTAHILDLLVFAAVVFSTEGYTSPFFTFSLFLILSSSIRWGGKQTVWTAISVNLIFLLAGFLAGLVRSLDIDEQRLLIRTGYLIVLSLLCVWFAFERDRLTRRLSLYRGLLEVTPVPRLQQQICDHVAARLDAGRVICVSQDEGEPWPVVHEWLAFEAITATRADNGEGELLDILPDEPFLIDAEKRRILAGTAQQAYTVGMPEKLRKLAVDRDLGASLGLTVKTEHLSFAIFAANMHRLSLDKLTTATELGEEINFMVKQSVFSVMSEQAAAQRTRLSIGRDLHDSVAQVVAGISFRLEGFKRSGKTPVELASDIDVLQDELAIEQRQLRVMIADLRRPGMAGDRADVTSSLSLLAERLGRQWDIVCTFTASADLPVSLDMERELNQMIREGVANAVRHGGADRVDIVVEAAQAGLVVEIIDNGGLGAEGQVSPRTLTERAKAMGGNLQARTRAAGTRVRLELPMGTVR